MTAQRQVWGETLLEMARQDWRTVVLDGDLATSTQSVLVQRELPDAFIQMGIAEANLVAVAAGMATLGYLPWTSTFSAFISARALDQVRVSVSQTKLPVRLAGSYAGMLTGASGKTHQDLCDLAVLRTLPNLWVLAPADAVELRAMLWWSLGHPGPLYLRLARDDAGDVFGDDYVFEPGRPRVLAEGGEVVAVSTGVQTARVAAAVRRLAGEGIVVGHVHLPSLVPLDADALAAAVEGARRVVTFEDHASVGGLGGVVCESVAERGLGVTVTRVGVDAWVESAPNEFLLDQHGLSEDCVAGRLRDLAR